MAAQAADTIVGFLYRVHRHDRASQRSQGDLYEENHAFNEFVDSEYGPIRIFESVFAASDILFQMEPDTYRILAAEFAEADSPDVADADAPPEFAQ